MRGPKELITRPTGRREARRRALAPSWAVVTRLCWRESAQPRRRACVAVCSGWGPVYARVCACEAHPSRGRQIGVCGSPVPLSPVSLNPFPQPSPLSGRASLRFPTCFSVCLRCPSLTHSSLASTSRTG